MASPVYAKVFADVVAALNAVQPYDWATFLKTRLEGHGPGAPLEGLARSGYRLVYDEKPTEYLKSIETANRGVGTPAARKARLLKTLSNPMRLARAPQPV